MQINKTNNVIFLKDVESNIIQEAFVVLKENVIIESDDKIKKEIKPINVLKEAEIIINQEIDKNKFKFDKYKILKLQRKLKIQKIFNILSVIALIIFIIK